MRRREKSKRKAYDAVVASPVGRLGIVLENGALADISFLGDTAALQPPRSAAARIICRKLQSYSVAAGA